TTLVASYGTTLTIHRRRPKRDSAGSPKPRRRRPHGVQGGHGGRDTRALRCWLRGRGERTVPRAIGVDRKTARRYITVAVQHISRTLTSLTADGTLHIDPSGITITDRQ
ncbi:MAG: hypothetical protein ACRDVP_08520, partial [Acidimicrobiales bacterium]